MRAHTLNDHLERDLIVPALGDDYVRFALGRFDKLLMHGLYRAQILVYNAVKTAASVAHVADYAPEYAHVGVGIDVNLYISSSVSKASGWS